MKHKNNWNITLLDIWELQEYESAYKLKIRDGFKSASYKLLNRTFNTIVIKNNYVEEWL